uniref:Uncharacterized protein n=1 Tax=Cyanoderma ruficeps TaxID=181631 RepID=A0A8C3RCS4_9PASS
RALGTRWGHGWHPKNTKFCVSRPEIPSKPHEIHPQTPLGFLNPEFLPQNPGFPPQNPGFPPQNPRFLPQNPRFLPQNPGFLPQNPPQIPEEQPRIHKFRFFHP